MPIIKLTSSKHVTAARSAKAVASPRVVGVRPIRSEADHRAAIARLEALWGSAEGSPERDEFDVLSIIVEAYEKEHHPIDPPSPIDAIRFRMEQMGWTRKELEAVVGTRARVSEILTGKRKLSLEMIRSIRTAMGISADILVGAERAVRRRPSEAAGGKRRTRTRAQKSAGTRRRDSIEA